MESSENRKTTGPTVAAPHGSSPFVVILEFDIILMQKSEKGQLAMHLCDRKQHNNTKNPAHRDDTVLGIGGAPGLYVQYAFYDTSWPRNMRDIVEILSNVQ